MGTFFGSRITKLQVSAFAVTLFKGSIFIGSSRVKSEGTANPYTQTARFHQKALFFFSLRIHFIGKAAFSINGLNLVFCDI